MTVRTAFSQSRRLRRALRDARIELAGALHEVDRLTVRLAEQNRRCTMLGQLEESQWLTVLRLREVLDDLGFSDLTVDEP